MRDPLYSRRERPGPIALVGSGEFLPVMRETDRHLLAQVGGPAAARVVVIPTASGLEPGMPEKWAQMGVDHFRALGATVEPVMIVNRIDTREPVWLRALEAANFYYFSGGNPEYLIETFRDTPAWDIIRVRHLAGAVLAGCSAGAMMLGGATIRVREVARGAPLVWLPALGIVPRLATIPHFDRLARYVGEATFRQVLDTLPEGLTLLGVDEDTALVHLEPPDAEDSSGPRWQVMGQQTVTVFAGPRTVDDGPLIRDDKPKTMNDDGPRSADRDSRATDASPRSTVHGPPSTVHGLSSIVHRIYRPGHRVSLAEGFPVAPAEPTSPSSLEDQLAE